MTRHRFFIAKEQIKKENIFITGSQARQIHQVLRLRPGDTISVLDNDGWEIEVEIKETRPDLVTGRALKRWLVEAEPGVDLTIYQSQLKQDRFEWVLQKGTELGAAAFVPMITERSVLRQTTLKKNKVARWERIMCEAAEQSGRGHIPTLSQPIDFATAIQEARSNNAAVIPWTGEKSKNIEEILANAQQQPPHSIDEVAIILGFVSHGCSPF